MIEEINSELLMKMAKYFREYPEEHDQHGWYSSPHDDSDISYRNLVDGQVLCQSESEIHRYCGTSFCNAGLAVALSPDFVIKVIKFCDDSYPGFDPYRIYNNESEDIGIIGTRPLDWITAGRQALGLSYIDASRLFDGEWEPNNNDLPQALEDLANGASLKDVTHPDVWRNFIQSCVVLD